MIPKPSPVNTVGCPVQYSTISHHKLSLTKPKVPLLLLGYLGEGSEGEGTLHLAHMVFEDGVR